MDGGLVRWGLRRRSALPRLWLFTDPVRLADPRAAVAALPRGRAGVVLRHDGGFAGAVAAICRERRLVLVVAGDGRLAAALGAGTHLRGGRWPSLLRPPGVVTSSGHSVQQVRRARLAGAGLVFVSPAFATASHAGAPGLGVMRWAAIARCGGRVAALGGVDGRSVRRLPGRWCQAAGAIGALGA